MENQKRDIFAEARIFLKKCHLAKYGIVAEDLRVVRIENPPKKPHDTDT